MFAILYFQIQGFASDACTDMVKSIIQDYHTFQTDSLTALRHLTHTSQCFTSNFITTLTYLYSATGMSPYVIVFWNFSPIMRMTVQHATTALHFPCYKHSYNHADFTISDFISEIFLGI